MAMFAPIPLPGSGSDVFKDIADYLEQVQQRKAQQQQFAQQQQMQQQQFAQNFGLAQSAENRAQQLQPLEIQAKQFAALQNKLQYESDKKFMDAMNASQGQAGANNINQPSRSTSNQAVMPTVNQAAPTTMALRGNRTPIDTSNLSRHDIMQIANQDAAHGAYVVQGQSPPMQKGAPPTAEQGINPPVQQGAPQLITDYKKQQDELAKGNQVMVIPPQPGKAFLDDFAGQTRVGHKIEDVKPSTVNGIRYDHYPSGKVIATKVGPSEEEKADIHLKAAEEKEQAKADVKWKADQDKYFEKLGQYADDNEAMAKILSSNPTVTGLFGMGKKYIKMGDADQAKFDKYATAILGPTARELSDRGGAVALRVAQKGKFDYTQPHEYNTGMSEANIEAIIHDYNRRAQEYKEKTGKEPPLKLSQFYRDWEKKNKDEEASLLHSTATTSSENNGKPKVTKSWNYVQKGNKKVLVPQ
jgi:hypothetical protein